jgi:hypothetical protein
MVKFGPQWLKFGCRLDFEAAARFLTLFLAETILKFSSNEAEYTPNR